MVKKTKKQTKSFGRSAMFVFFMSATVLGFAFGALLIGSVLLGRIDTSDSISENAVTKALSDLAVLGVYAKGDAKLLNGVVSSVDGDRITVFVGEGEQGIERSVLIDGDTRIIVKRQKSQEELNADREAWGEAVNFLDKKIISAKAEMVDCGLVDGMDCSDVGEAMDEMIKERGVIESEHLSVYASRPGNYPDLSIGDEVMVLAASGSVADSRFTAATIEVVKGVE